MKKFLLMCVVAAALTGCAEYERDRYYVSCAPVCGAPCASCHQTVSYSNSCISCARPAPQPKQVVVVVPAPQPQPVIEHEIVYQPQPSCGCSKCGCHKAK